MVRGPPLRLRAFEFGNRWAVRLLGAAPTDERCIMGSVVSRDAWCRRWAVSGTLWCKRHTPAVPNLVPLVESPPVTNGDK